MTRVPEVKPETYPKPDFVAELKPHRSLSAQGFVLLMLFVGATCFISGVMFLVMGAWPVFLFMGLDVVIVWVAFKVSYRSGKRKERISVGRDLVEVEQHAANGRISRHSFNPFWTRFEVDRQEHIGVTEMRLTSKGRSLSIGSFLTRDDKDEFATTFARALAKAKS